MTPTEFLTAYFSFAQKIQQQTGVPAQVILAQAALESGWGKSELAKQGNNFFGIKADSSWKGATITKRTREVKEGKDYFINAPFRKYATPGDSFADHANFLLNNKRYKPAFAFKDDPKAFAAAVAKAGYATDPKYTELLHKLIDSSSGILSRVSNTVIDTVKKKPVESGLILALFGLAVVLLAKK